MMRPGRFPLTYDECRGCGSHESNLILARVVAERVAGAEEVLVVDLHTGHGVFGTYTLLSHVPLDHPDDAWLRQVFESCGTTAAVPHRTTPSGSARRSPTARSCSTLPAARWSRDSRGPTKVGVLQQGGSDMGLLDSVKSMFGGHKNEVKQGIDKAADVVDDKAGEHADKVQQGAEMAKDAVDKLPDA
jgi:hypothetical protein